jgi:hypothetical protein
MARRSWSRERSIPHAPQVEGHRPIACLAEARHEVPILAAERGDSGQHHHRLTATTEIAVGQCPFRTLE